MKSLSDYEPEDIALLADADFRESVQAEARSMSLDAFDTYREVMSSSDDDQARIKAADKIITLAGFEEKQQSLLPSGISEDVFKLALAGLGQLAGIAKTSASTDAILRNVTPAASDTRLLPQVLAKTQIDDSPMNLGSKSKPEDDNEAITNLIAGERYEIRNPT